MLRTSFEIFSGIGPATAAKIRQAGFHIWDGALSKPETLPLSDKRAQRLVQELATAKHEFAKGNVRHFDSLLKPREAWLLFSTFAEKCLCFDIETTGLSPEDDDITIISTYRPATRQFAVFVKGRNLADFPRTVHADDILVGFNSRAFDHPFLCRTFGEIMSQVVQVDLRWVLNGMGIKGRLKDIERTQFGITRPPAIQGFSGEEAVEEWKRWTRTKDKRILDRLIMYASADTFILDYLARETCRKNGCTRFATPIDPSQLFRAAQPAAWPQALPPLPPRPEIANLLAPAELLNPEEEEEADALRRSHYEVIFLMALTDEMVSRLERRALDLFASKYGISRRAQEEIEHSSRVVFDSEGARAVLNKVLAMSSEWQKWYFEELAMFSWIDGSLDRREQQLLGALADACTIPKVEIIKLRADAIEVAKALLEA